MPGPIQRTPRVSERWARADHRLTWVWNLPGRHSSPRRARKHVRSALAECGLREGTADALELIASELVTNAVRHTRTPQVVVQLAVSARNALLTVTDQGPTPPSQPLAADDDESGRGLPLINAMAASWGIRRVGSGSAFWACVDVPAHGAHPREPIESAECSTASEAPSPDDAESI